MFKKLIDRFFRNYKIRKLGKKNRQRFEEIISDKRFNFLEPIYQRLFNNDPTLSDNEVLEEYFKFSDNIQTNTFAAAELELVIVSVLCHFRPALTDVLIRRGLLSIVYSIGDNIDWITVRQFIDFRILAQDAQPYGGLPPVVGQVWLSDFLPRQKDSVQNVLEDVIRKNRKELGQI
jgi:hypothetical protein